MYVFTQLALLGSNHVALDSVTPAGKLSSGGFLPHQPPPRGDFHPAGSVILVGEVTGLWNYGHVGLSWGHGLAA